ncbi:unnamed protein product [Rhizophagus irregularis]|nr:unnamed protein product [Rhizophagus irregularis]
MFSLFVKFLKDFYNKIYMLCSTLQYQPASTESTESTEPIALTTTTTTATAAILQYYYQLQQPSTHQHQL